MRTLWNNRKIKISLYFAAALVLSIGLLSLFEKRFDEKSWKNAPNERHKMVDDLMESQILLNKTKGEVVNLLGKPSAVLTQNKDAFVYKLGDPPSFIKSKPEHLLIVFESDSVSRVTLAID